jgi:hypothetical protein
MLQQQTNLKIAIKKMSTNSDRTKAVEDMLLYVGQIIMKYIFYPLIRFRSYFNLPFKLK